MLIREILFRGKRISDNKWTYGGLITKNGEYLIFDNKKFHKVSNRTVGMYTGLVDKFGIKVFEGDIVVYEEQPYRYTIRYGTFIPLAYAKEQFHERAIIGWYQENEYLAQYVLTHRKPDKIIGNIYDNNYIIQY